MEINHPITFDEVDKAINKLKSGKAPGLNGISPKMYKAFRRKMRVQNPAMLASSLMAPETTIDGTKSNVFWFHRRLTLPTPTNGEVLCLWMSAAKSSVG